MISFSITFSSGSRLCTGGLSENHLRAIFSRRSLSLADTFWFFSFYFSLGEKEHVRLSADREFSALVYGLMVGEKKVVLILCLTRAVTRLTLDSSIASHLAFWLVSGVFLTGTSSSFSSSKWSCSRRASSKNLFFWTLSKKWEGLMC